MSPDLLALFELLKNVQHPFTLVFLATLTGAIVRILKTKKAGDLLDAIPFDFVHRIPPKALPWVALGVAGLLSFLDSWLNAKVSVGQAALQALIGMVLGGGTAIGGHETLAKLFGQTTPPSDPPPVQKTPEIPPPPKVPEVKSMRANFIWAALLSLVLMACAAFQKTLPFLPSAGQQACIINEVEHGDDNPLTIINRCELAATITQDLIDAVTMLVEGAKRAKSMRLAAEHSRCVDDAGAACCMDGGK